MGEAGGCGGRVPRESQRGPLEARAGVPDGGPKEVGERTRVSFCGCGSRGRGGCVCLSVCLEGECVYECLCPCGSLGVTLGSSKGLGGGGGSEGAGRSASLRTRGTSLNLWQRAAGRETAKRFLSSWPVHA